MLSKKTIRAIAAAIAVILVVTIAGGSLISAIGTAQAASVKDLKGKISSLDSQKAEIQKVIDDLEGQIGGNLKKMEALKDRMELTKQDINATETVIVRLSDEIETKKEEIVVAQEELDEKTEIFETRMRVMYENGNDISYLDVILGSNSFGEMLSRLEIVSEIMEGDKKVVSDYKEAKQTLEDAKAALEQDKEDQETYKSTLESKYDDLVSQKQEIQELTNKLESDQAAKQKEEDAIDAEKDRINAEIEEKSAVRRRKLGRRRKLYGQWRPVGLACAFRHSEYQQLWLAYPSGLRHPQVP